MKAHNTIQPLVPTHSSAEQTLAVVECLHVLREALWITYGPQVQRTWRDQLGVEQDLPPCDPDAPFRPSTSAPSTNNKGPGPEPLFLAPAIQPGATKPPPRRRIEADSYRRQHPDR